MGAFLLHHQDTRMDETSLAASFAQRGFRQVQTLKLGSAVLHLARKSRLDLPNLLRRPLPGGLEATLAVTGTVVYDGLPWQQALERLMDDLLDDRLRPERLAGACCLLFHDPSRNPLPRVIGDPSGLYHLFQDEQGQVLSSSQLLTLAALPGPWLLDRAACLDLLTAGYLVAPRTLFRNLRVATTACPPRPVSWMEFLAPLAPIEPVPVIRGGLTEHLEFQLDSLREHLSLSRGLTGSLGVDMGLSGGYDSRLLVLLVRESGIQFSAHTHVKRGADADMGIARQLAAGLGVPLAEVETGDPLRLDTEAMEKILDSSFGLFDGNAVSMMSLLKEEYTPSYRAKVLGGKGVILSGVGGEIYRNHNYSRPWGVMETRAWVAYYVINHLNLKTVTTKSARERLVERQTQSILKFMGAEHATEMDLLHTRRYYGEVWLSNWHGVRNSAESSAFMYLAPFSDRRVFRDSLASRNRLGVGGSFEAAMIRSLDPGIAAIPSSYGHSFTGIPAFETLRAGIRAWLPNPLKLALAQRYNRQVPDRSIADKLASRHPVLKMALTHIEALELPIDLGQYLSSSSGLAFAMSLGYILHRLESRTTFTTSNDELTQSGVEQ